MFNLNRYFIRQPAMCVNFFVLDGASGEAPPLTLVTSSIVLDL